MDQTDIDNRFKYHQPPNEDIARSHSAIRSVIMEVANTCNSLLPEGREKSLAITKLEEAMFWANAAIARS
jgi:hypothetical protein